MNASCFLYSKKWGCRGDFPGGTVDSNPPADAEDMVSIPGLGRSHVPWIN